MQERNLKSLDSLDMRIIERVSQCKEGIPIYKLQECPEFAEVPDNTFRYRIETLGNSSLIRLAHRRKYVYVYPAEG